MRVDEEEKAEAAAVSWAPSLRLELLNLVSLMPMGMGMHEESHRHTE
jgi:hypothetical protein